MEFHRIHYSRCKSKRYLLGMVGFTSIELVVTTAVLAVLTALALPSFTTIIDTWHVRQTVENLQSTLYYARSEAIRRGGKIVIQKVENNTNGCTTAEDKNDWDCGWFICEDSNGNGKCAATEPVLKIINSPQGVQVSRTGGADTIKFNRWGLVDGAWLGFSLVPSGKSTTHPGARCLCMSAAGRTRIIPPEDIPCTSG